MRSKVRDISGRWASDLGSKRERDGRRKKGGGGVIWWGRKSDCDMEECAV